eukprot:CAMPEP_0181502250 /NCGR_PEP_ID=MMETSP1110-20121109/56255_1 /TAXON_ID=174948 /ORGANISM="Symbiodinium sp., Strain CCMP421" /LENGTH=96 /DNA_ID=CAMNT_0023630817 /DNA_START=179 /DNA_END=469 /DNA_ORIENTATION=-
MAMGSVFSASSSLLLSASSCTKSVKTSSIRRTCVGNIDHEASAEIITWIFQAPRPLRKMTSDAETESLRSSSSIDMAMRGWCLHNSAKAHSMLVTS